MPTPPLSDDVLADAVSAVETAGSKQRAAAAIGISRATLDHRLRRAAEKGLLSKLDILPGFIIRELSHQYDASGAIRSTSVKQRAEPGAKFQAPLGHQIKGVSALMDAEGRVVQQWVKTRDGAVGNGLVDALKDAFESYSGLAPVTPAPEGNVSDMLTVYPVADLHFGMMSWGRETGEDYDLKIAGQTVRQTFDNLVSQGPPSGHAMIALIGDLLHQNDQSNMTPRSGHQLDVDGRYPKVLGAAADAILHVIGRALQKHDTVWVCVVPGNHDPEAAVALHLGLRMFYGTNGRVTIDPVPAGIIYRRWGANLFGFAHGHQMPPDRMAHAMAADRPEEWGQTTCRRFYAGHFHRESTKVAGAVKCEYVGTPIPKDAHSFNGGWRAERIMRAFHFHHERGETGTTSVFVR
jgi:hypothetical protein